MNWGVQPPDNSNPEFSTTSRGMEAKSSAGEWQGVQHQIPNLFIYLFEETAEGTDMLYSSRQHQWRSQQQT